MEISDSDEYMVYLQEHEFDIGLEDDPISFSQAKQSVNSLKWMNALLDELKSMSDNDICDLVELSKGVKTVGCKWVFKTKRDLKGNIERYKARLVAKGFTQKEGIDYKETFSLVSSKDSLRIVMALVAHYDLELHQMDVKTAFLNSDVEETIYMVQPKSFQKNDLKLKQMEDIPYASAVGSLTYALVCTRLDIVCTVGMFCRCL